MPCRATCKAHNRDARVAAAAGRYMQHGAICQDTVSSCTWAPGLCWVSLVLLRYSLTNEHRGILLCILTAEAAWAGEGQKQNVDDMLAAALQYYGEHGELNGTPVPLALEREKPVQAVNSPLRFPGKLAADLAGNRLFISDSNNHRWAPFVLPHLTAHGTLF